MLVLNMDASFQLNKRTHKGLKKEREYYFFMKVEGDILIDTYCTNSFLFAIKIRSELVLSLYY